MLKKNVVILSIWLSILMQCSLFAGWAKTYGGAEREYGIRVLKGDNGGYVVGGGTSSFGVVTGVPAGWLLMIDSLGDTLWTRCYSASDSCEILLEDILRIKDEAFVMLYDGAMSSQTGIRLIKITLNGDTLWTRTYAGDQEYLGTSIKETSDCGFIVSGQSIPENLFLMRLDSLGDTLWVKEYTDGFYVFGGIVNLIDDEGYFVATVKLLVDIHYPYEEYFETWLLRTDSLGDTLWTRDDYDKRITLDMQPTSDDNYILTGGKQDSLCIFKVSQNGSILWSTTWLEDSSAVGRSVCQTTDGGYVVCGSIRVTDEDCLLLKVDSLGKVLWQRKFGGWANDYGYRVLQTGDGGYIIAGQTESFGAGKGDLWLIKTDSLGLLGISEPSVTPPPPVTHLEVASPIGSEITLRYSNCPQGFRASVYDASGRKVDEIQSQGESGIITWGQGKNPGVYFIKTNSPNTHAAKVVLLI